MVGRLTSQDCSVCVLFGISSKSYIIPSCTWAVNANDSSREYPFCTTGRKIGLYEVPSGYFPLRIVTNKATDRYMRDSLRLIC